jgi:Leucyl-tRNA synthetase
MEFLKENKLSLGDNFRLLLERLDMYDEGLIKSVESKIGEPAKMSKSKANTVDPEFAVQSFGADTIRLYILFAGPVEKDFEWTDEGVQGAYRFLKRLWNYFHERLEDIKGVTYSKEDFANLNEKAKQIRRKVHQTLKKYLQDMEELSFNTAIASIMELVNTIQEFKPEKEEDYKVLKEGLEIVLFMLYPITPHICEELWNRMGHERLLIHYPFPEPDQEALKVEEVEIPVQINGKLRGHIRLPVGAEEQVAKSVAIANEKIRKLIEGKRIVKVVYVKDKLINLVVSDG